MKKFILLFLIAIATCLVAQEQRSNLRAGQAPFFHGVASGDPLSNAVMLWTRVTPPTGDSSDVTVYWQIATDVAFNNVVNFGKTKATQSSDYTVKLDVCGLQAGTYYYYVFRAFNTNSVIGRTKTAPSGNTAEARFAVASCSSYEHGYFNAYESMSRRNDLDAIIHLGDYIYEYESGGFSSSVVTGSGRTYQPTNEVITLSDYRIRHSHYKLDDQLQRLHQIHPFITTWDDHETANDSYKDGAQNHDPATEGTWADRKVSGTQAYKEWMPIRNPDPNNDVKIWRSLRYGNLLDLIVLDSRLWARDEQDLGATNSPNRNLLGNDQFQWLEQQLSDNSTQWKVICQQVMMAPLEVLGFAVNADQWDGYNKDRNRLIDYIEANNVQNPVILTGDIHTTWVNNVPGNATTNAAVEFVVTSVTSPGLDVIETALGQIPQSLLDLFGGAVEGVVQAANPHMQYINVEDHGYMVLTVNGNRAQGDYIWLDREVVDTTDTNGPSYYTVAGSSNMLQAGSPMAPITGGAVFPPPVAIQTIPFVLIEDTVEVVAQENQFMSNCLVSLSNVCPAITTNIIQGPQNGFANIVNFCFNYEPINNFNGTDYFTVVVCQFNQPSVCDTVVVEMNVVPNDDIQTFTYEISNDSLLNDCPSFNDLATAPVSFNEDYTGGFLFDVDNNGCFTYQATPPFSGVEYVTMVACDSIGICDTVILEFIVGGASSTQIVNLSGAPGELLSNCLGFDDLNGNLVNSDVQFDIANSSALVYNDTCLSYSSDADFEGVDTLVVYGCDDFIPITCDTIVYYIEIINPDTVPNAISEVGETNDEFAVIGIYPTPFESEVLFQYYQFKPINITLTMYDMLGKVIYKETINDRTLGLKYARLETTTLSRGQYMMDVSSPSFHYTKMIQKY